MTSAGLALPNPLACTWMSSGFGAKAVCLSLTRIAPVTGRQNTPKTATETNIREVTMAAHARPEAIRLACSQILRDL